MLPTTTELLKPQRYDQNVYSQLVQRQDKYKDYYNRHAGNNLRQLRNGDTVMMETKDRTRGWRYATVESQHPMPRSYAVKTPSGTLFRRNRKMLKPTRSPEPVITKEYVDSSIPASSACDQYQSPKRNLMPCEPSNSTVSISVENDETVPTDNLVRTTRSGRVVKKPSYLKDFVN
ncbi:Uncharacterised protein g957 [Pycnogonum litorale]